MKKFILLIGLLFFLFGCSYEKSEYRVTVVYTIGDGDPIEEVVYVDMTSGSDPVPLCDGKMLKILAVCPAYNSSTEKKTIYYGSRKVDLLSFEYELVRTYMASGWDGHELKRQ